VASAHPSFNKIAVHEGHKLSGLRILEARFVGYVERWQSNNLMPEALLVSRARKTPLRIEEIDRSENLFRTGKFETSFRKHKEKNYFEVGTTPLYARCHDETLIDEFIKVAHSIITNKKLLKQFELRDLDKKMVDKLVEHFKTALNRIIDDFDEGHINLKGTCRRCKDWRDELARLS
jgi:hypothetical protein